MAKGKYEQWKTPEGLLKLEGWARDGLTDEQIAKALKVSPSTLYDWENKYPEISEALKKGKEIVDRKVENALLERALGGIYQLKKTFKVREKYYDKNGKLCEKEHLETGIDEVFIPGDTTAQIFWLKNRKPDVWRDKRDVEVSDNMSDGFLEALSGTAAADWSAGDEEE